MFNYFFFIYRLKKNKQNSYLVVTMTLLDIQKLLLWCIVWYFLFKWKLRNLKGSWKKLLKVKRPVFVIYDVMIIPLSFRQRTEVTMALFRLHYRSIQVNTFFCSKISHNVAIWADRRAHIDSFVGFYPGTEAQRVDHSVHRKSAPVLNYFAFCIICKY